MATLPVRNPRIPVVALIPGGLRHGSMLRIIGELPEFDRFDINLQTGNRIDMDDINMHLSIRPTENAIVRNHFQQDAWGHEERFGGFPIQIRRPFTILILTQNDCFKIAVNGTHFSEFRHRIPFTAARYIHIGGNVQIHSITLEGDAPVVSTPLASAPPLHSYTPMNTYQPGYQPPPPSYEQAHSYQSPTYQPMQQHIHHEYPPGYNSMSSSTYAAPSPYSTTHLSHYAQPQYQHHVQPQYQTSHHQPYQYGYGQQYQTYQQFPQGNTTSKSNNVLKYAAGIGGIGLGAYALSHFLDGGSNECSDED